MIWLAMPGTSKTSLSECLYAEDAGATRILALFRISGLQKKTFLRREKQ